MSGDCGSCTSSGGLAQQGLRSDYNNPNSAEYRELQQLKARDREVRQHERAHQAAGGGYVQGGPSFSYQKGPDGQLYAVGGEVSIDTSAVQGDPQATLQKMRTVRAAALAPGEPSGQDMAVAAQATQAAAQAQRELQQQQSAEGVVPDPVSRALQTYRQLGAEQLAGLVDERA